MDNLLSYSIGTIIEIDIMTTQRVAIQSANNLAPAIDLQFPVQSPYARLIGRWIIECKNQKVYLRENDSEERDDCIVVSFQQPEVKTRVSYAFDGRTLSQEFNGTTRIDIYPREVGKIKVQTSQVQPVISGNESSGTNSDHETMNTVENDEEVKRLKEELRREREISRHLQSIVDSRLDEVITEITSSNQELMTKTQEKMQVYNTLIGEQKRLNEEEQGILDSIDTVSAEIDSKREAIDQKKAELEELQQRLEELEEQRELSDLDCDSAKKQLEEIKAHVCLDSGTVELLESGGRLKHGSVSKTLTEMEKEIEKVEKKIAFIIKYRTKFNQVVEDAIFNGDGTILTTDEAGGNTDGNGSTTSTEN